MKIKADTKMGVRGEITCTVIKGNGDIITYPTENNTHTYTWFLQMVGSGNAMAETRRYDISHRLYASYSGGAITKESTGLGGSLGYATSTLLGIAKETILGVSYISVEFEYAFALGAINNTVNSVGVFADNQAGFTFPSTGMICGKVLGTPVEVTSEDQLIVKYKRFYNGPTAWQKYYADWATELPVTATGAITSPAGEHSYTVKLPVFVIENNSYASGLIDSFESMRYNNSTAPEYRSTLGGGRQSIASSTRTWQKAAHTSYNADSASFEYSIVIPPAAGTMVIAELEVMGMCSYRGSYYNHCLITFDPPLTKPDTHKLAMTIDYTISWDNI